jgi:hypothetical protein
VNGDVRIDAGRPRTAALVADLVAARADLLGQLDRLPPADLRRSLVGDWDARQLVAHVGYWVGNAVEVVHMVEDGRADEVGLGKPPTDEVNATVARVATETDLGTARRREEASVEALVERLHRLDERILDTRLPGDSTLEQAIREDGSDHYREHADALRQATGGGSA